MHLECGQEKYDSVMALLTKENGRAGKVVIDAVYIILYNDVLTPSISFWKKILFFHVVILKVNAEP